MFRKLGDAFRNFMMGRYGSDTLNKWLLIFGVVLILLGSLLGVAWLNLLAYVPLGWCIFRMYSRNIEARRREKPGAPLLPLPPLPSDGPRPRRTWKNQHPLPQMQRAVHQKDIRKRDAIASLFYFMPLYGYASFRSVRPSR